MNRYLPMFLLLLSAGAHGALNKWVDDEGLVHYSDQPPPANVKAQTLTAPAEVSGVAVQKSILEREAERKKLEHAKAEAAQKAAQQQEAVVGKQKNCEAAKANLQILESAAPITTYNDKGERTNMDDTTRQQRLEEARKQIGMYCN